VRRGFLPLVLSGFLLAACGKTGIPVKWESKLRLKGADMQIEVFRVQKGRPEKSPVTTTVFATDREMTGLEITVQQVPTGNRVRIAPEGGTGPVVTRGALGVVPLPVVIPLPAELAPGDYVLGGTMTSSGGPPWKTSDIVDGFLLRARVVPAGK